MREIISALAPFEMILARLVNLYYLRLALPLKTMVRKLLIVLESTVLCRLTLHVDEFLQRTHWVVNAEDPIKGDIESLCNWHKQKGFINRQERAYVSSHSRELLSVGYIKDKKLSFIARTIESITLSILVSWNRVSGHSSQPTTPF
jgi:hypothetical protein